MQAPFTAEQVQQVPKEVSAGLHQEDFSQEREEADHAPAEELPFSSSDKSAPVSSEQAPNPASNKTPVAPPHNASGSPSEKASTPSPPAKPALSTTWVGQTPTKSAHPLASRSPESAAITDAEPAPKLKENKEAKPDTLSGSEQETDSWRLAAHYRASSSSSSSSTEVSCAEEGSTAACGDCGGSEQQEAADAAETFSLQPTDPQDTVAVEELPLKSAKEEQSSNDRPLQRRKKVRRPQLSVVLPSIRKVQKQLTVPHCSQSSRQVPMLAMNHL